MDYIPRSARSIALPDSSFQQSNEFLPLQKPGQQLPSHDLAELDLFRLYIDDATLDRIVVATNAYAERKRTVICIMYRRFKLSPLIYKGRDYVCSIATQHEFHQKLSAGLGFREFTGEFEL